MQEKYIEPMKNGKMASCIIFQAAKEDIVIRLP
jgi:hypothetical protein